MSRPNFFVFAKVCDFLELKSHMICTAVSKYWHENFEKRETWKRVDSFPESRVLDRILANDPPIQHLELKGNLSPWQVEKLERNTHLKRFFMSGPNHVRAILQGCTQLEVFSYHSSDFSYMTDADMDFLTRCPRLKYLQFGYGFKLTDESLSNISLCTQLKYLDANHASKATDRFLEALSCCRLLTHVDLQDVSNLTDNGIEAMATGCPLIGYLNLDYVFHLTDRSIEAIAKNCPNLRSLSMKKVRNLSDSACAFMATMNNLRFLQMSEVKHITGRGIATLADMPRIEHLILDGFQKHINGGVAFLAKSKSLKILNLQENRGITGMALEALKEGCPNLEVLIITECFNIEKEAIEEFMRDRPEVKIHTGVFGLHGIYGEF